LNLTYDEAPLNVAFNFNLRRYNEVLDERLALQVLRSVPGFSRLTGQMLRDCGVVGRCRLT
jgi:hypothetical protein